MTWVLIHEGRVVATGTYAAILDEAESLGVCARAWHPDGTEFAPKLVRGWMVLPEAMADRQMRRAA